MSKPSSRWKSFVPAVVLVGLMALAASFSFIYWATGTDTGPEALPLALAALAGWLAISGLTGARRTTGVWWALLLYWGLVATVVPIAEMIGLNVLTFIPLLIATAPWYAVYDSSGPLAFLDVSGSAAIAILAGAMFLLCAAAWVAGFLLTLRPRSPRS